MFQFYHNRDNSSFEIKLFMDLNVGLPNLMPYPFYVHDILHMNMEAVYDFYFTFSIQPRMLAFIIFKRTESNSFNF